MKKFLALKGKQASKQTRKSNQVKKINKQLQQPLSVCMYMCVCACECAYVCAFNNALNPPAIIDFNDKTNLCFIYRFLVLIAFKCNALLNTRSVPVRRVCFYLALLG